MARKEKKGGNEDQVDLNAWMTTFGDLIMLLLTFFVLLLTMKAMDSKTVKEFSENMTGAKGPLQYLESRIWGDAPAQVGSRPKTVLVASTEMLKKTFRLLEGVDSTKAEAGDVKDIREALEMAEDDRGVIVSLESSRLFKTGETEIKPDSQPILDMVGKLFKYASNDILIMGHTDNRPIHGGEFESNWDISFYRALNVFFYLADNAGLNPKRLAVGGYADVRPLYENNTEENRSKNRRVEFILRKRR